MRERMKLHKLHLRDLFWLIALVAMGLGWWMDRNRLASEVQYLKSTVNGVSFIEIPLQDALMLLSKQHGVEIAVDWKSLKTSPKALVTHNFVDGSLPFHIHQLFLGREAINLAWTSEYLLITGNQSTAEQP